MKNFGARPDDCARELERLFPKELPARIVVLDEYSNAKRGVLLDADLRRQALSWIVEVEVVDGLLWAHLSVGGVDRVPHWDELVRCKELFLGDRRAIQVLPPKAEYINHNPRILHLYAPLEHEPLPDFRGIDETGKLSI